jgi:hypothetical protein
MSKHSTHAIVHTLFAVLIAGAGMAPSNALADAEPKVLGKTIGEWSVKWWQWALEIPASTNPMLDGDCEQGQQGPVWFLAGVWEGKGELHKRICTVPRGKHILFSIANSIWIQTPTDPPNYTEPDYRREASAGPTSIGGQLEATLDGDPIIFNPKTPIIRSQSPVFTASFPPDNVFGANPRLLRGPIVSDGYWVMLPPLSRGEHTLFFKAGQSQNVTYTLKVK